MMYLDRLKATFEQSPELIFAAIGFACYLVSFESMRLTTLTGIYPVEPSLVLRHLFAVLVALIIFVLYKRIPHFRLGEKTSHVVALSLFFSFCLFAKYAFYFFGIENAFFELFGKVFEEAASVLLLIAWAERLLPYGFRRCLVCLASSFIILAVIQVLLSFFQQVPSMLVIALLPLVSGGLYGYFKTSKTLLHIQNPDTYLEDDPTGERFREIDPSPHVNTPIALFWIIIVCFFFIIGHILYGSLETQQSMAESPIAQIGIALGNALAGIILLVSIDFFKSRHYLPVYTLILFALMAVAFYLTTFTEGPWISTYLLLSNMILKLTTVLIWMIPFMYPERSPAITSLAFGYMLYFLAKVFSSMCMLIEGLFSLPLFNIITSSVLLVLLASCLIFLTNLFSTSPSGTQKHEGETMQPETPTPFQDVMKVMGIEFSLTPQEKRILPLLAQGRNVKYVSESLVITSNTTKSHMRNIYAKLNVHSQQELINLVDNHVQDAKKS